MVYNTNSEHLDLVKHEAPSLSLTVLYQFKAKFAVPGKRGVNILCKGTRIIPTDCCLWYISVIIQAKPMTCFIHRHSLSYFRQSLCRSRTMHEYFIIEAVYSGYFNVDSDICLKLALVINRQQFLFGPPITNQGSN